MSGAGAAYLDCTTTDAGQTLTLAGVTFSASTTVSWGDGDSDTYSAGAATRTHVYADAGTYRVRILQPQNVTSLDLRDTKISLNMNVNAALFTGLTGSIRLESIGLTWTVSESAPFPSVTSYVNLNTLPNLTWTVSTDTPFPSVTSYVYLVNLPNLTWTVSTDCPFPSVTSYVTLHTLPNLTWSISTALPAPSVTTYFRASTSANITWAAGGATNLGGVGEILFQNSASQAAMDAILLDIYNMTKTRTKTGGTLNLATSNAAPSGTYQAAASCPVGGSTPGKEIAHELVYDGCGAITNTWTEANITA